MIPAAKYVAVDIGIGWHGTSPTVGCLLVSHLLFSPRATINLCSLNHSFRVLFIRYHSSGLSEAVTAATVSVQKRSDWAIIKTMLLYLGTYK